MMPSLPPGESVASLVWPAALAIVFASTACWETPESPDAGFPVDDDGMTADVGSDANDTVEDQPDTDVGTEEVGLDSGQADAAHDTAVTGPVLAVPEGIGFDWPGVGASTATSFEIRNTGSAPFELTSLDISESGDEEPELTVENSPVPTDVAPGGAVTVEIEYQPANQQLDEGHLEVRAEAPRLSDGRREIPFDLPTPRAELPQFVNFSKVSPGTSVRKDATLVNAGSGPLTIDGLDLDDVGVFTLSFFDPENSEETLNDSPLANVEWPVDGVPETLAPGEELGMRIWFEPTDNSPQTGMLTVASNDPASPNKTVELVGNSPSPCLALSHETDVAFGQTPTGETQSRTVTVENCRPSTQPLAIQDIEVTDDGDGSFAIRESSLPGDLANGGTTSLEGDDRVSFVVTFNPADAKSYRGNLRIDSNDPARQEHDVELTGSGTDASCPVAVARGRESGSSSWSSSVDTYPLRTIELDATSSNAPDGSIDRYQWSIIGRPSDSNARLTPSSTASQPSLFVDRPGIYRVELVVYNNQGIASCGQPAIVEIEALPEEDLYAELVWNTPADPDETDTSGTDLDLHYLNAQGSWNQSPWDCFWHNKNPDWGTSGDASDDPELMIDDTDGAGPEAIRHEGHVSGQQYDIGVHYKDEAGFGPSYATVRIYHQGSLQSEWQNKFMEGTGDFWHVATFTGSPSSVVSVDQKSDGFP